MLKIRKWPGHALFLEIKSIQAICLVPLILLLTQYFAGGKIEKNGMGWACGAYGGGERCAQGSGGET